MNAVVDALASEERTPLSKPSRNGAPASRPRDWVRRHARSLVWLAPVLAVSGVVQSLEAGGPTGNDDEAAFTAQAWAVVNRGALAHHDYWYDQFPLGWAQIAVWTGLIRGFDRYDVAVLAAREAMIVFLLVGVVLLWMIARRLGMSRPAAAAATVVFALSPLAVLAHRSVTLENVATPWMLASVLLAMCRRNQVAASVASMSALGVAALSKESSLVVVPLIAWLLWRGVTPGVRSRALAAAAVTLLTFAWFYLMLYILRDGVAPPPESVRTIGGVVALDPVLSAAVPVAVVAGLAGRLVRPFALTLALLLAVAVRPDGAFSMQYLVLLLPFAALVIAEVGDTAVRRWRSQPGAPGARIALAALGIAVLAGAGQFVVDRTRPSPEPVAAASASAAARSWVLENVEVGARLIVDDVEWVALAAAGFDLENLISIRERDTTIDAASRTDSDIPSSTFIVATPRLRGFSAADGSQFPPGASAVVAVFGAGEQRIELRRAVSGGAEGAGWTPGERVSAGAQLLANAALTGSPDALAVVASGSVDERVIIVLGQLLSRGEVTVADFPPVAGERGHLLRRMLLTSVGGRDLLDADTAIAEAANVEASLNGAYATQSVVPTSDGVLVTFPVVAPHVASQRR
jgi:hypothetical protein